MLADFEAVADAAFEVYRRMEWSKGVVAFDSPRWLEAGLFRTEDRRGNARYSLYPRLPQRWQTRSRLLVHDDHGGEWEPLVLDAQHAGRFLPLSWTLDDLGERRFLVAVDGTDERMDLVLPGRDFWILVPDPDDEYSDALATWGLPVIGEHFLLLCRPHHEVQLEALSDLGLLSWAADGPAFTLGSLTWREYRCQVLRPRWDHVVPRKESRALVETLRPRPGRLTISLEGGLSVPGQNVWLQSHPPKMRVRALEKDFRWVMRRRSDMLPVHHETSGEAHQLTDLPDLPAGEYDIEVRSTGGLTGRRVLRIASWGALEAVAPSRVRRGECPVPLQTPWRLSSSRGLRGSGGGTSMTEWFVGRRANFHLSWEETYRRLLRTIDAHEEFSVVRVIRRSKDVGRGGMRKANDYYIYLGIASPSSTAAMEIGKAVFTRAEHAFQVGFGDILPPQTMDNQLAGFLTPTENFTDGRIPSRTASR